MRAVSLACFLALATTSSARAQDPASVDHPKASAIRVTVDTGSGRPAGAVDDSDQVIVALSDSEVSLAVDGRTTNTRKRGDVVFIGRNVTYDYKNAGKPADFVVVAIK